MLRGDEYSNDFHELKIPNLDLDFFSCFPSLSPQNSAETFWLRKEKKEEEFKCQKISGGLLWGPCSCSACEEDSSSRRQSPYYKHDDMHFAFPSPSRSPERKLVVKKDYFSHEPEDFLRSDDVFLPNVNIFDEKDYDEVLVPPRNRRRKKYRKRPRDDLFDDDYDFDFTLTKHKKKKRKSHQGIGRLKHMEDIENRTSIMSLYEKGTRSRSETGYLGVRISTSGRRFRATVNYLGKPRNVGTFDTPKEAALEYDKKLLELSDWKIDRNRLNFCDRWDLKAQKLITGRPKRRKVSLDFMSSHI